MAPTLMSRFPKLVIYIYIYIYEQDLGTVFSVIP